MARFTPSPDQTCKVCGKPLDASNKAPERLMCLEPCFREYKASYRKPRNPRLRDAAPESDLARYRKKQQFLAELLRNGGFVEQAIRTVKTSRRFVNDEYNADADFATMWDTIIEVGNEQIEQEIYRRAVTGVDKPLAYQGKLTGHVIKEWSDNLLMFIAKARMPAKYRDQAGKGAELSEEELNAQLSKYLAKRAGKTPELATEAVN